MFYGYLYSLLELYNRIIGTVQNNYYELFRFLFYKDLVMRVLLLQGL